MRRPVGRCAPQRDAITVNVRALSGVAPVLHFPVSRPELSPDAQRAVNTRIALEMVRRFRGPLPAPYVRTTTATVAQVEKDVEGLLGGAAKLRKTVTDDDPMDKVTLMENCLRHHLWNYYKEEGKLDFAEMQKWLVYTPQDATKLAALKRREQLKETLTAFRARRSEAGKPDVPLPLIDWAKEYQQAVDREVVAEKRHRYDQLAVNTTEWDEAQVQDLLRQYRTPTQDKRLDALVALVEQFKPVLAREAIMQRLTIKHLEGQLGIWRYLDWHPEVRDRAELECDLNGLQWWSPLEERRLLKVRLRSRNEMREVMEKTQEAKAAASAAGRGSAAGAAGRGENATREKLLREVLALQARLNRREDDVAAPAQKKADAHH